MRPQFGICLLVLIGLMGFRAVAVADKPADAPPHRPVVYAWFPAKFGSWKTDSLRWDLITHLCYRSVELKGDGTLREPLGPRADAPLRDLVRTAHKHSVKVTVLVWVNTPEESDAYLASAQERAAQSLLEYVRRYELDGINIDDEKMRAQNLAAMMPNRDRVTQFFRTLRATFDKEAPGKYHISYAAPPVISDKDRWGASWLDLAAIAPSVDAIIPMGYTMNPPTIGWTTNTEPLGGGGKAPTTTTRDMQTMVADYLRAMGGHKEKLLVGVSLDFGGYEWRCRTDQPLSPIIGKATRRTLAQCEESARRHGFKWDEKQATYWYAARDGDAFIQGWYHDPRSWAARLKWIREQGLGGVGIWVLDGEADPAQRWKALEEFR